MSLWPEFEEIPARLAQPGERVVQTGEEIALAGEFVQAKDGRVGIRADEVLVRLAPERAAVLMEGDTLDLHIRVAITADGRPAAVSFG